MSAQTWLPLRPMTYGEVLDTAVALLRRRALVMLGAAAVLAAGEQVLLAPLRAAAGLRPPYFWLAGDLTGWWLLTALGFAIEATIITLLGGLAAASLRPELTGRPQRDRQLWRAARPPATALTAIINGILCGFAALAFVPWIFVYGFVGPAAPALVIDRVGNPFSALARSAKLASAHGLRGSWIRVGAYLTWFAVRLAFGAGWIAILTSLTGSSPQTWYWAVPIAWGLADTVAYATLACVDAVLLVETRIRVEGLDIALNRSRSRGEDAAAVLAHHR